MENKIRIDMSKEKRPPISDVNSYYDVAKSFTLKYYWSTYNRILLTRIENVDIDTFFKEYVWVVHASGFSARAVSAFWDRLWEKYRSVEYLNNIPVEQAIEEVSKVVNNPQKIKSVWKTAKLLTDGKKRYGWETFRYKYLDTPGKLQKLGHIGEITKYHLARNIGILDVVKPDLHLERMAKFWEYESPEQMCRDVEDDVPLGIKDFILWTGASEFGTQEFKK